FARDVENHRPTGDTLLVWTGDKAHEAPDFLAVVDFDRGSPQYGKILRIVPLPAAVLGAGAVGNEPHHIGLSRAGRPQGLGGRPSGGGGQPQVFSFAVPQALRRKYIGSPTPSGASATDESDPLNTGGFLATLMGGPGGAHPGRVVEYNADVSVARTLPIPT